MNKEFGSREGSAREEGDDRTTDAAARQVRAIFWVIALLMGFTQAWSNRFAVSEDGLAYLDMGDMLWRGDFQNAANAIWSPGYPSLLGLAFEIIQPTAYFQSSVIQLVNVMIFAGSIWSFDFFLRRLYRLYRDRFTSTEPAGTLNIPGWAFLAIGYTLFLWSGVVLINVSTTTPDMLLSGFVYLTFGLLVRIRMGHSDYGTFALLGVALGLGYLSKAPMFPLAFIYIGVAVFLVGDVLSGLRHGLLALGVFVAIAAPWIMVISLQAGAPTFGKSGAYLYAREVNDIAIPVHWQGWPPEAGSPEHPTRIILEKPAVFEFGSPVVGTYPPWQNIYVLVQGDQATF